MEFFAKTQRVKVIAIILIASLLYSCTMGLSGPESLSDRLLAERAAKLIDMHLDEVKKALREDESLPEDLERILEEDFDARQVASRTLSEEGGREYLEFALYTDEYSNVDEVFNKAESMVSSPEAKAEIEKARAEIDDLERNLEESGNALSRVMNTQQRKEYNDIVRKMVIKAAVLLTAAIVYAFVPNLVVWGKVTAACAAAIAAGVLASAIYSLCQFFDKNSTIPQQTFEEWITEITKEPAASWGIASAVLTTSAAFGYSPVIAAVILGVFTVYQVWQDFSILKKISG